MSMRIAFVAAVITGACAIHPPPAQPPPPPQRWAKPSVQRDCEATCADRPERYLAHCIEDCEHPVQLRCGSSLLRERDGWRSSMAPGASVAIPIGLVGIVVVSLMAAGVIGPSP